jgi:hypothetical protein
MLNVHLRIADAEGRPVPVRVRVSSADGAQFAPLGRAAEFPAGRNEDVGGHLKLGRERWFYTEGACEVPLPAGVPLRVQAAKGPEWTPLDEIVTLGAGQISLRFSVSRWANAHADRWLSVDTRCHFLSPHAALLEAQAEGLDVANLLAVPFPVLALDANTYTTVPNLLAFSGQVPALSSPGTAGVPPAWSLSAGGTPAVPGTSLFVNTLNTHPVLGKVALLNSHRPVFPLTFGGPEETDDWGVCDWCDQCHRKKGLAVWVDAFEPAGGLTGGEALVAAVLGKIDAIEVTAEPRKVPLLPWLYRLWDAGVLVPLVGASGKESNRIVLGCVRTYARVAAPTPLTSFAAPPPVGEGQEAGSLPLHLGAGGGGRGSRSWVEAVRAGRCFATAGPLLALAQDGGRFRAEARARGGAPHVEIVANGQPVASGGGAAEAGITESGWVAARCLRGEFAHTSAARVGAPARRPEAVAVLKRLIEQTREWAESHGRYTSPKRRQSLLDRCGEALARLEGSP